MEVFGNARWITEYLRKAGGKHAPVFRKRFTVGKAFAKAECAICGLGHFELKINNRKVSEDLFTPGFTRYDRRSEYYIYDVTEYLQTGENIAEVTLGNNWFNQSAVDIFRSEGQDWKSDPKFLLNLVCDNESILVSDPNWLVAHGPILENTIRTGERFDARKILPPWQADETPDPNTWKRVYITDSPGGILTQAYAPACRITKKLEPQRSWQLAPGKKIYDFGVNIAGNCQIKVKGPVGGMVKLVFGEKLGPKWDLDNSKIAVYTMDPDFQHDWYLLNDADEQLWAPTFTYHGFRYVQVTLDPGVELLEIEARVIRSNFAEISEAKCSDAVLNKISELARRSFESNFVNHPTDCPHREKMGWTGDAQLAAELGLWNYDVSENYRAYLDSMRDCQRLNGQIPGQVPFCDHWQFGPVWDSALIILPYQIWRFTGDITAIGENYLAGKRLMDYFASIAVDHIVEMGPGDWCHWSRSMAISGKVDATAYYCYCADILSKTAAVAGYPQDEEIWKNLAGNIRQAFRKEFCRPGGHCAKDETTALALALTFDLAEPSERSAMAKRLNDKVLENNCKACFGISGAKAVPRALAENGYFDTALTVLTQKELPGWGWWLDYGATSLWEDWGGTMSLNHVMFGDPGAWLWEFAGGIHPRTGVEYAGFKRFTITPPATDKLTSFTGQYRSPQGVIEWAWEKGDNGKYRGTLIVPENCTAEFCSPGQALQQLPAGEHQLEW